MNRVSYAKLLVNDSVLPYQIRFSRKAKYLQLRINSNSLELIIPNRYSIHDGEKFLNSKIDWIKKYSAKIKSEENKYCFFGEEIKIQQSYDLFIKRPLIRFENNILTVRLPKDSNYKSDEIYFTFLKKRAKEYLPERIDLLSKKIGIVFNKIGIRGQKTRWGSCSSKGKLSFNFKLMKFRSEVIDYVIIHELCHLKEMNHSKKFWNLVEKFCPDYKRLRKELKS